MAKPVFFTNRRLDRVFFYVLFSCTWFSITYFGSLAISEPSHLYFLLNAVLYILFSSLGIYFLENRSAPVVQEKRDGSSTSQTNIFLNKNLAEILNNSPSAICILEGSDFVYNFVNNSYSCLFGNQDYIGRKLPEVFPEMARQGIVEKLTRVYKEKKSYTGNEQPLELEDNGESQVFYRNFIYQPLYNEGDDPFGIFVQAIDVTPLVKAKNHLVETLKEKEILLKELHHRVKNNLAIIAGLIELQTEEVQNSDNISALQLMKYRIYSIAGIHEVLYQEPNLNEISFDVYIKKLISTIFGKHASAITSDLQHINLNINQAVPLGLLLNEILISINKISASPQKTRIIFMFKKDDQSIVEIIIRSAQITKTQLIKLNDENPSIQATLIHLFSQQLNADFSAIYKNKISEIRIAFPWETKKGSASNL